jgi:uncharacterized protein YcbK (DUF882 family)
MSSKGSFFKLAEFQCQCKEKCPGKVPNLRLNNALLETLNRVRERFAKPIIVTSGFRCKKHNNAIGGAVASQHLLGTAADIRPASGDTEDLQELFEICKEEAGVVGLGDGRKKGFIHVDVRPGQRKEWTY